MADRNHMGRTNEHENWSRLWKLQAPPKTKHLLWRLCTDCLPTRTRLLNRHVQCLVECFLCEEGIEEDWHLFFECNGVQEAWAEAGLHNVLPVQDNTNHNITTFIFESCRNNNNQIMGRVATLLWCIWNNRNDAVWNNNKLSARQLGLQAKHMWLDWAGANGPTNNHPSRNQQPTNNSDQQWQHPPLGTVKCNVDASFFVRESATGWGWCVRDHAGRFILAGTDIVQANLHTLEGEIMALVTAMQNMVQKGFSRVIFESDSKVVIDAITSTHFGISEFSVLISYVKSLLLSNPNFEVKFIRRQTNMVAHLLARAVYSIASCQVFDFMPSCIASQLFNEMS